MSEGSENSLSESNNVTAQSSSTELTSEQLPLSSFYKVIDHVTIFKSEKWWEAVVVIESLGRRSIAVYLWTKKNDAWKRKHKFQLRSLQDWEKVKGAIDKLVPKLSGTSS
jgi:hypothetical protein